MNGGKNALFWLATVAALTLSAADTGRAQNRWARGPTTAPNPWARAPSSAPNPWARGPSSNSGAGNSSYSGPGGYSSYSGTVAALPGVIVAIPSMAPCGGQYIDNGTIPDGLRDPRRPSRRAALRGSTGGERRLVLDGPMPKPCIGYRPAKGRARAN